MGDCAFTRGTVGTLNTVAGGFGATDGGGGGVTVGLGATDGGEGLGNFTSGLGEGFGDGFGDGFGEGFGFTAGVTTFTGSVSMRWFALAETSILGIVPLTLRGFTSGLGAMISTFGAFTSILGVLISTLGAFTSNLGALISTLGAFNSILGALISALGPFMGGVYIGSASGIDATLGGEAVGKTGLDRFDSGVSGNVLTSGGGGESNVACEIG